MKIFMVHLMKVANIAGGLERMLCNLSNEMIRRGHEVHILTYDENEGMPYYPLSPKAHYVNIREISSEPEKMPLAKKIGREITRLRGPKAMAGWYERYRAAWIVPAAKRLFDEARPDVIIVYKHNSSWLVSQFCGDCPVVQLCRNDPRDRFPEMSPGQMEAVAHSALIQALTPEFQQILREVFPHTPTVCIPNAVPQFELGADLAAKKERCTILQVGRLTRESKRQHLLIVAFSRLAKEFPEWDVVVWGTGNRDYREALARQIEEAHLGGRVVLKGTKKEIFEEYPKADIFAIPSAFEGFPNSMAEAMSAGLPVVGFASCSGVNEIVENGKTGILTADGEEAFAEGLQRLMEDRALRVSMGHAAKEAMKAYAPETIWDRWEQVLLSVSKKNAI